MQVYLYHCGKSRSILLLLVLNKYQNTFQGKRLSKYTCKKNRHCFYWNQVDIGTVLCSQAWYLASVHEMVMQCGHCLTGWWYSGFSRSLPHKRQIEALSGTNIVVISFKINMITVQFKPKKKMSLKDVYKPLRNVLLKKGVQWTIYKTQETHW